MKNVVKASCSFLLVFCCTFSIFYFSPPPEAIAGDARGNAYLPDETAAFILYARHKTGDRTYKDGNLVGTNGNYELNYQIVRPAYYKTIGGIGTSIQALIPFGDVDVRRPGTQTSVSKSGLMDPTILFGFWPVADRENKFWINILEYVTMPLGDYDTRGLVNLGSNRWGFKTVLGITKGWGKFWVDLEPSIEFYTKNDDFFVSAEGRSVDQDMDPMFRIEGHLSYDFTPTFRLAAGYFYENGGEKSYRDINGVKIKSDEKDNHAVDITAFFQLAPKHQLLVQYMRDIQVENGFKCDQVGLRYFYIF